MLTRYACTFSLILLGFLTMSSVPPQVTPLTITPVGIYLAPNVYPLEFQPQDKSDEYLLTRGILTSKLKEGVWFQCGLRLPEETWYAKAVEVAEACVYSARPLGVDPVGQLATWQQESRLDPCALGPYSRAWAVKHGLLKVKRLTVSYTKAEVKVVLTDPRYKASFYAVDIGLAQVLHPYYTHGATLDEMLSMDGAIYSAQELAHRGRRWRTDKPWNYWPGHKSASRAKKIDWWVYTVMEIDFLAN